MPFPATLRVSNIWSGPPGEPALVTREKDSCSAWRPLRAVGGLKTSSSSGVQKIRRRKKETEPPQCIIIQAIGPPPSEEEYYKAVDAKNTG